MKLAPVVLFTYDRLRHTEKTIEALRANELASETDLIIYSDGAKRPEVQPRVDEVRQFLKSIKGFRSITVKVRERNYGLGANIIDGVTEVINTHGRAIVLEDDLITSPYFLKYMNEALNKYEHEDRVISIVGYVYPVESKLPDTFFVKSSDCLGWATWKRGWDLFENDAAKLLDRIIQTNTARDFDFNGNYPYTQMLKNQLTGKVDSWAIRWYATAFVNNKLSLFPGKSLVFHNGNDLSGTNYTDDSILDVELSMNPVPVNEIAIEENTGGRKAFEHFFRKNFRKSIFAKAFGKFRKMLLK